MFPRIYVVCHVVVISVRIIILIIIIIITIIILIIIIIVIIIIIILIIINIFQTNCYLQVENRKSKETKSKSWIHYSLMGFEDKCITFNQEKQFYI